MIKVGDKILFTHMIPFGRYIYMVDRVTDRYIDYTCSVEKVKMGCTVEHFKNFGIVLSPLMLELL